MKLLLLWSILQVYAVRADALSAEKLAEYQEKYKEAIEKGIVKPTKEKEAPKVTHKRTSYVATVAIYASVRILLN